MPFLDVWSVMLPTPSPGTTIAMVANVPQWSTRASTFSAMFNQWKDPLLISLHRRIQGSGSSPWTGPYGDGASGLPSTISMMQLMKTPTSVVRRNETTPWDLHARIHHESQNSERPDASPGTQTNASGQKRRLPLFRVPRPLARGAQRCPRVASKGDA